MVHRLSCVDGAVLSDAKFEQTLAQWEGPGYLPKPGARIDRAIRGFYREGGAGDDREFTVETATAESDR